MRPGNFIAALISALLTALSFPRPDLWILAWIGMIPLLWTVQDRFPRDAALLGWCAGTLHYAVILYWLLGTMESYGGMPTPLALAVLLLLVLYLGAFWALFVSILVYIRRTLGLGLLWVAPPLWCAVEALRGSLLTGFPWALSGYSQSQQTTLVQIADITGIIGVSFLLMWVNCTIIGLMEVLLKGNQQKRARDLVGAGITVVMVGATLFYGAWRTRQITAISDTSIQVSVGIAQGNIDQSLKWDPAFQEATVRIYEAQTRRLANEGAQLVVWPETAAPFFFQRESPLRQRLLDLAQAAQVDILFGSPAYGLGRGPQTLFNRAYLIGQDGVALGSYDKMHLVPFGEYVPMRDLLFFVHKMVEGIGEFSSGEMAQVLPSSLGLSLGVMICFESIFPEISRTFVQNDADVLVNLTNDAWFGDTAGPYQHLSMLTLRAVENRRWIIRAANTGISAFIDPCGRVVARIPLSQQGILVDNVHQLQINSFYSQHGELFLQACSLWGGGLLVLSWGLSLARKRRKNVVP